MSEELFGKRENDGFKVGLSKLQAIHVGTDDFELLSLPRAHQSVDGSLNFFGRSFATRVHKPSDVKTAVGMQQELIVISVITVYPSQVPGFWFPGIRVIANIFQGAPKGIKFAINNSSDLYLAVLLLKK
ncbi:hypothetical protein L9W92_16135 [Pelotomaculum terephthalicicum JT]|uniref:hypothetical protein n=1 Tax=Pelotomaculum terephthalicicum TaxID=206393 RepID=UPI0009C7F40E|nr:hypothetical protein [Pelotomaculum terephthalicicum]MCG9969533.1 hypothetical protein [Pelotomaculum terephthalicicum JT]OPY59618.1 MAG: hypothetical protein A4E56_03134 [Pelotomaculum sp. PtaU1.Bin065]